MAEALVQEAKAIARSGDEVSAGTAQYYRLLGDLLKQAGMLLDEVQIEVWQESEAAVEETRQCITCEGEIIKKHKRGRWPIYCEACAAKR